MNAKKKVVITGIGVLSSNGNSTKEFFRNSIMGKGGIEKSTLFDANNLKTSYIGQIKKDMPYITKEPSELERINYIIDIALKEALDDSNLTKEEILGLGNKAYLSFATSLAANGRIMGYVKDCEKIKPQPEWLLQIPSFITWLKEKCGVKGGCYTDMAACAAGTTSAGIAYDLIRLGKAELVIVGGADPITEFSCVGFHALKALSNDICKPFDESRDGINIGEAGAFMIFETLDNANKRNAKIYAEVLGYGINNDSYHITSPHPQGDGAFASMKMAMEDGGISGTDINVINAHGTGTKLNDLMECKVINKLFGDDKPYVFSNKGMVGHCLAAAGVLELAATALCIKNKCVMPSINVEKKMEEFKTGRLVDEYCEDKINYAISNSYAFAGNTASIIIGAY